MRNSDAFLAEFSRLEKWLAHIDRTKTYVPFSVLVDRVAKHNAAVNRFSRDLKEFADLRNAIVHERGDGHVIAEPNDRALADLSRLCSALTDPPALIPKFQKVVKSRRVDEELGQAVRDMRDGSFSQMPVLREGVVVAVLTAETIARWLATEIGQDVAGLSGTKISDVLSHTEDRDHYCLLPRRASLLDALESFETFASRGKDLDAILVTNDGRPEQGLLGIVTLFDLPAILSDLGLKRVATN